jgi:two-component system, sensor histidine kinase and response regulator
MPAIMIQEYASVQFLSCKQPLMEKFILIIDDNLENLKLLGNLLKDQGYKIAVAKDGISAFKILAYSKPLIILLDVMMPDMDGYEVCKLLKENQDTADIPVIFLTAKNESKDIVHGFKMGGADYVTKPFNSDELIARLNHQIELINAKSIIEKQAEELSRLNKTKDRIFSIISHDMRTPIASILMMIQTMNSVEGAKRLEFWQKAIKHIELSASETHLLLENLLNWSLDQMQVIRVTPVYFNLIELINSVIKLIDSQLYIKNIEVSLNTTDETIIYADEEMIKTIIRNILNNAVKFSFAESKILIEVKKYSSFASVSIKDYGTGMSSEMIEKILDKNSYHSTIGTKGEKGTGLGIKICQSLIKINNGNLDIESALNKGTKVTITLPDRKINDLPPTSKLL